jgi:hypothetical protein
MPRSLPTRRPLLPLLLFVALAAVPAARAADSPDATTPALPSAVGAYAGEGPHGLLVISPREMGEQRILVLTDLGTGAIRALFPAEPPWQWVAGETLRSPEPPAFRLRFGGAPGERPTGLVIEDVATGATWRAPRVPLRSEEVEIRRDGLALRGTLHLPPAAPGGSEPDPESFSHPGIILAPGSEDEGTRHSLDALPYVLAREGFAVLAVDKRGTGASEGSWDVDHDTLAGDLVAWVEWLADRPELDGRIGVFGFSEGGWIAPLAASRTRPHPDQGRQQADAPGALRVLAPDHVRRPDAGARPPEPAGDAGRVVRGAGLRRHRDPRSPAVDRRRPQAARGRADPAPAPGADRALRERRAPLTPTFRASARGQPSMSSRA